jgi:hypothetical protein
VTMRELRAEARRVDGGKHRPLVRSDGTEWVGITWEARVFAPTRAAVMAGLYAALKTMRTKA